MTIGNEAFSGCSGLTSIDIPNSVTRIGNYAFASCRALTSATIGNSVTGIEDFTFYRCTSLASVTIGNSVESIGKDAFMYCNSLTSVSIPNNVTSIGEQAFACCPSLTSITIGDGVKYIGYGAFMEWENLTNVYCYAEEVPETGGGVFNASYYESKLTLHVPAASTEAYGNEYPWKNFGKILALTDSDPKPAGIVASTVTKQTADIKRYDLSGRRASQHQRGLNIVKMSDGTTKKVVMK
jgi:hypothetical protein